jgi:predicted phage tail protein
MLRDIYLHGALGKQFGRHHRFDVATPGEAIRAFCSQYRGFRQALSVGHWRLIRGDRRKGQSLGLDEIEFHLGRAPLHIVPVAAGSGGRGAAKILVGITLVAVAVGFAAAVPFGAVEGAKAGALGLTWGAEVVPGLLTAGGLAKAGAALTFSGVAALLSPQPKAPNYGATERRESYLLTGPTNTAAEGVPVPIIYGRCRVGSVVASVGISVEDWGAAGNGETPPGGKLGVLAWGKT